MISGIFFGFTQQSFKLNLLRRAYTTCNPKMTLKTKFLAQQSFENRRIKLSFDEYKEARLKNIEEFKESSVIKELCGTDIKKISKAYEAYCQSRYNNYAQGIEGGNSALMI